MAIYLVGVWLVFQAADIFFPAWGLPDSTINYLLAAAALGLPIAALFGWMYEWREGSLVRTTVAHHDGASPLRPADYAILASMLVAAAAITTYLFGQLRTHSEVTAEAAPIDPASVAVLPFDDLSPGADQGYFSAGMHEEIITQLSRVSALRVPSRTTMLKYRGAQASVGEIATQLGVAAVLAGSVRHAGQRVRISVQLIDGVSDVHLWSRSYDRELTMEGLIDIQSDVALRIAATLERELTVTEADEIRRLPTHDVRAYDQYLQGRAEFAKLSWDGLRQAKLHFEQAVALDPDFARAHQSIGWVSAYLGTEYGWLRPAEAFAQARQHALRALELDPNDARSHELLASILFWHEWDVQAAEPVFQRAVAMNPRDFSVHTGYAYFLSSQGRHDEAIAHARQAIAVDPHNPRTYANLAWRLLDAWRFEQAMEMAERALVADPTQVDPVWAKAWAQIALGEHESALQIFQQSNNAVGEGYALGRLGRHEEALEIATGLEASTGYVPPHWLALIYTSIGDHTRAFQWLERGLAERNRALLLLPWQKRWEPLRSDPRFAPFVARLRADAA